MTIYFVAIGDLSWWILFLHLICSQKTYSDKIICCPNVILWVMKNFVAINQFSFVPHFFLWHPTFNTTHPTFSTTNSDENILMSPKVFLLLFINSNGIYIMFWWQKSVLSLNLITKNVFCCSDICVCIYIIVFYNRYKYGLNKEQWY